MATVPSSELELLYQKLFALRSELLDLADHEVHVGYAAAYRAVARQVTQLMNRISRLDVAVSRREAVPEEQTV